jgi:hypothetical protein
MGCGYEGVQQFLSLSLSLSFSFSLNLLVQELKIDEKNVKD